MNKYIKSISNNGYKLEKEYDINNSIQKRRKNESKTQNEQIFKARI